MRPVLQALLLADHVYKDEVTGKHVIAGTFNTYWFKKGGAALKTVEVEGEHKQFISGGAQSGSPYAYISLTDVRGEVPLVLRYVNLEQDQALFELTFTIQCDDPLRTVEFVLPMPRLPIMAGIHAVELLAGEHPLGSHRVTVKEIPDEEDRPDGHDS